MNLTDREKERLKTLINAELRPHHAGSQAQKAVPVAESGYGVER